MPIAITDEQSALQSSIREWAKRAATIEVVRDQEGTGDDPAAAQRWASLAELGFFALGLPESAGGDGTTSELAAALAQATESLVPGPVLPTVLAGQLLATGPAQPVASDHLPALAAGQVSVAVALGPGRLTAIRHPDGGLLVSGVTKSILGAGTTTHLLLAATTWPGTDGAGAGHDRQHPGDRPGPSAWFLIPAGQAGLTVTPRAPADFSRSLADVAADGVAVAAGQVLSGVTDSRVRDLAAALASAEAAAVASWCSRTAADYAAIRHQFGRPIGAFQAVKHLCAQMQCRAETASVLAWDAARAVADGPDALALVGAAAAAHAIDAAVANAKDCIQVLGGIGFTWEHDAHLYLRRALSLRQLLGGTSSWRIRAARLAAGGARRVLMLDGDTGVDGDLTAIRHAARQVAAAVAKLPAADQHRALADAGYVEPGWPPPYGLGASAAARLVIDDELGAAGLTRPDIGIGGWAIPAILGHGSQAQQNRFAGPTLRGELRWCQLFSEPEAGSDLASLRSRAERVDGDGQTGSGWRLTGQKVWTSLAREADWAICLARTDAAVAKHQGITYFLVRMDSPGIEIRPLREMTGREMFNQVFLDQVFVPDDCVVGPPGAGWRVTRTTLASERVAMGAGSAVGEAVEGLLALCFRGGQADGPGPADPVVLDRIGALIADGMAVSLLDLQAVLAQLRGEDPASLAAVRKLVGVRHRQEVAEAALELSGPDGASTGPELAEFLLTRCLSIAGGTTQILLSLVAERLLGLPREEAR